MNRYVVRLQRYVSQPNEQAVQRLVAHCGIALRYRDASTVAVNDPSELARIRDGFCAKQLGLSADEAEESISAVCQRMRGDTAKCRVAFYYLLAARAGRLDDLCKKADSSGPSLAPQGPPVEIEGTVEWGHDVGDRR